MPDDPARTDDPDATAPPPDPNATLAAGEAVPPPAGRVGDYELLGEIARGGMGVVYRARQVSANRVVALKMILAGGFASAAERARFRAEAEAAAGLDHPHIMPVYEVGESDGRPFFSMKLADGGSLADKVPELVGDPKRAAGLVAKLSRAVHFAHQRAVLHRDLKPANILLDAAGEPLVTDFGLARRLDSDSGQTRTGAVMGTPSYMPPEQARGDKGLTTAADVYSLGAVLYELLTGRPPFREASVMATVKAVLEHEPADPRSVNPAADRDLAAVALKCLAKEPAGRYAGAAELADDLDRWGQGEPTVARPPSLAGQVWRWLRRYAGTAAAVLALGVAWGGSVTLLLAADAGALGVRSGVLLPDTAGPDMPVWWVERVQRSPAVKAVVTGAAVVLSLGVGWLLRLGGRPPSPQAALAAGATAGLVAALVFTAVLGGWMGADAVRLFPPLHPIEGDLGAGPVRPADAAHLARFLPPGPPAGGDDPRLADLLGRARQANRANAGMLIGLGLGLMGTTLFLAAGGASGWAADHVARSGRGPLARGWCYLELYLPTAALALGGFTVPAVFAGEHYAADPGGHLGWTGWATLSAAVACLAALAAVAYAGVTRRWHPLARAAGHLALLAAAASVIRLLP